MQRTRVQALADIGRVLGLPGYSNEALMARAAIVLGQERADRCAQMVEWASSDRRWSAMSAIAALVAGTDQLGRDWWSQPLAASTFLRRPAAATPDDLLATGHVPGGDRDAGSCLPDLANWIMDDATDAEWGAPLAEADGNDPMPDTVVLPASAVVGQRFLAWFDPGSRVEVIVVDRTVPATAQQERSGRRRGPLGSDLGEWRIHDVAEVEWAWGIMSGGSIWTAEDIQSGL